MTDSKHTVISKGYITVDNKRYRYEISKMDVEVRSLPIGNYFEVWNEDNVKKETVIWEGDTPEKVIRKLLEWGKW